MTIATSVVPVHPPLDLICDLSDRRYDGCEMWGDARMASGAKQVGGLLHPAAAAAGHLEHPVVVLQDRGRPRGDRPVPGRVQPPRGAPPHGPPGHGVRTRRPSRTSNYWHAFSDVLLPLFTMARALGGDVELLATGRDRMLGQEASCGGGGMR